MADTALHHGVQGIAEIINQAGTINRDFADVKAVLQGGGMALMGIGLASGEHRALEAAQNAVASPLLDGMALQGAQRVLVNILAGPDAKLGEIKEAAHWIQEQCAPTCNFFFGYVLREDFADKLQVTLIATGASQTRRDQPAEASRPASTQTTKAELSVLNPFFPKGHVANYGVGIQVDDFHVPTVLRKQLD